MRDTREIVVVDSSVAFKWFLEEREQSVAHAWRLLSAHLDDRVSLVSVAHMRLEVLNALRRRGLTKPDLGRAAAALEGFRIGWREVDGPLTASAVAIACDRGLTLYDAAFAALALALDAELATEDLALRESGACRMYSRSPR